MSHIEFMGPAGSGKSTLYEGLIKNDGIFGGVNENGYTRYVNSAVDWKYSLVYRLVTTFAQSDVENIFIKNHTQRFALQKFVSENPEFMKSIGEAVCLDEYDPGEVWKMMAILISEYSLGTTTVRPEEQLCMDEGFAHRGAAIMHRTVNVDDSFSVNDYVRSSPTPSFLVHVDPPVKVCLDRQNERGHVVADNPQTATHKDSVKLAKELCDEMSHKYQDLTDTEVIRVENTGEIEKAISRIERSIVF